MKNKLLLVKYKTKEIDSVRENICYQSNTYAFIERGLQNIRQRFLNYINTINIQHPNSILTIKPAEFFLAVNIRILKWYILKITF